MNSQKITEINLISEEEAASYIGFSLKEFRRNRPLLGIRGFRCGDDFFYLETTVDRYMRDGVDNCNGVDHLRHDMHNQYLVQKHDSFAPSPYWEELQEECDGGES